ncbi:hypothetical protein [Algibacillus agarilyticus]|uniref:hypothetical protein n=1 Tax=Algibacillus agarilyticus TaxID=2234133 RepID=UPI000DD069E9|nr:hypothetical protein [Algibacillus agarilyticus]
MIFVNSYHVTVFFIVNFIYKGVLLGNKGIVYRWLSITLVCELSYVPQHVADLEKSFYLATSDELKQQWQTWLNAWRTLVNADSNSVKISEQMKQVNPKYTCREWRES